MGFLNKLVTIMHQSRCMRKKLKICPLLSLNWDLSKRKSYFSHFYSNFSTLTFSWICHAIQYIFTVQIVKFQNNHTILGVHNNEQQQPQISITDKVIVWRISLWIHWECTGYVFSTCTYSFTWREQSGHSQPDWSSSKQSHLSHETTSREHWDQLFNQLGYF